MCSAAQPAQSTKMAEKHMQVNVLKLNSVSHKGGGLGGYFRGGTGPRAFRFCCNVFLC